MTELIRNIAGYFPVQDPTWIFFIVLGIILFAPIVFGKLRIPHIIGMILAGMVIGEHGLNIIVRDSSFQLFGNVGLLYIMFLAGMEMDMNDFKQNRNKAIVFGLLGFIVPMAMGYAVNSMLLKYAAVPAMLVASMYASHTLVSYPIVSRYGMARQRSVSISVGATAITDCLTLFLLAILGGLYKDADSGSLLWLWLVVKVALLTACVIIFFPRIGRHHHHHHQQLHSLPASKEHPQVNHHAHTDKEERDEQRIAHKLKVVHQRRHVWDESV